MPDATVHWHQEDALSVDSWEFQYQQVGGDWEWVQRVDPVDGCESCFQAVLELPRTAILVRSRAVSAGLESEWSGSISALPEPDLYTSLAICGMVIIWLAGKRWGGRYRR